MALPSEYEDIFKNMARFLLNKKITNAEAAIEISHGSAVLWIQQIGDTDEFKCAVLENDEQRLLLLKRLYTTYGPTLAPPYTETEIIKSGAVLPPLLRAYLIEISREVPGANGVKHLIELNANQIKIEPNGPYLTVCTRRATADGRSVWEALYRPFDHFNRNINKEIVYEWLVTHRRDLLVPSTPAPTYTKEELAAYRDYLPSELCWYLENVSRELFFYSYPILFELHDEIRNLGKCIIPADKNWIEYDDDDLLNGMIKIGEGGCSFSTHIVVDRDSPHYGTIWDCDGDTISLEKACFMDYLYAAMR